MKVKNRYTKTIDKIGKNHKGNYEIGVTFDAYSKLSNEFVDTYIDHIANQIKELFNRNTTLRNQIKFKNINWN